MVNNNRSREEDEWINISSSPYDINEKFIELSKKYFNEDEDSHKVGMLGYMNEIMSLIARDGIHHRDMHYDEYFLNTARLPTSIYNESKMYKVDIGTATPSKMKVYMSIFKSDLIKYSKEKSDGSGSREFIINDEHFNIENYNFMLSHPVIISLTPTREYSELRGSYNDYTVSAKHDINQSTLSLDIKKFSPYIKTWMEMVQGEQLVFFVLDIYQIQKEVFTYSVVSTDISDNMFYNVDFKDQLANFKITYKHAGNETVLPAFFNANTTPAENMFAFYNYPDDKKLQIFFSGLPNSFRPKFNSELEVEVITTKGSDGNFTYKGDVMFRFKDREREQIPVTVRPMFDATGGLDRPSLMDVKHRILEQKVMRDNLITEIDLDTFFSSMVEQSTVNNSTVKFIRKRDDVLRRLFSAFILMKDRNKRIIPTNTIDIELSYEDIVNRNNVILPGTMIVYDPNLDNYRILEDDEMPENLPNDNLLYTVPFLIAYKDDPAPQMFYYRTSMDEGISINYDYINERVNEEFLVVDMDISRDSFMDDIYEIKLNINSTLPRIEMLNNVIVRGILKKGSTKYGYIDFLLSSTEENEYKAILPTDDSVSDDGKFNIVNAIHNIHTGEIIENVWVDEDMDIEIGILYNKSNDKRKQSDFKFMPDLFNYTTVLLLNSRETFSLYKPLNYIMKSELNISESGLFEIKNIPVVSSNFLMDRDNYYDFFNIFKLYEDALSSNIQHLENNTDVDMKLYNTFGKCRYSSIDTTHLSLSFNIRLHNEFNYVIDTRIKDFIMDAVEEGNKTGTISISNIIRKLENEFEEINYIEYNHMNNTNKQKIEYRYPHYEGLTAEQLIRYVPEYINVNYNANGKFNEYIPDIHIEYI